MPQPISNVISKADLIIGNNEDSPSNHHPELSLLAMNVIAEWSILDSYVRALFVQMLGSNPAPGAAVYSAINNAQIQRSACRALAVEILTNEDEIDAFDAIFSIYGSVNKERNKIAHWVWGHSPQIPNGVLLCDPNILMSFSVRMNEYMEQEHIKVTLQTLDLPRDEIFVYYDHDFKGTSSRIKNLLTST